MVKKSLTYRFCTHVYSFIRLIVHYFACSNLFKAVCGVVDFIADMYGKSVIHTLFTQKDIERHSSTSVFYGIICSIIGFFKGISDALFVRSDKAGSSSCFIRFVKTVARGSVTKKLLLMLFSFTGAFSTICAVLFCVPDSVWNNLYGLALAIVMFAIMLAALACGKSYVRFEPERLWLCFILFIFTAFVSTFLSKDRSDSIRVLAFFLTSFVICVSVSCMLCSKASLNRFMALMYVAVMFTGLVGVYQGIIGVEADASLTDLSLNSDMPGRVYSTFGNPNNFAEFIVLFLPFSFVYAINRKKIWLRVLLTGLLVLPVVSLLLTYSRSGWIAFAVAFLVFVMLYDRRLIPVCIILGIVAVPLLPQSILNRILTIGNMKDSSSSYRLDIWAGCIDMLKRWWYSGIGLGPGAFSRIYPPYAYGESAVAPHSHMQFMEILIESGFIGLVSYIWLTFSLIKRSCVASKCADKELKNIAIAGASAMTGIIFIGLFEYCWFYPRVMFAFFVCAGIVMAVEKNVRTEADR